jgi:hypothetical protein
MITRRQFLKTTGILGLSLALPPAILKQDAIAAPLSNIDYAEPAVIPQIINVFLYGGPSELAGNLTNIEDIMANSQNRYPTYLDPSDANNNHTPNQFWADAGGNIMEELLSDGQMSIYRTVNRIKDNSRAHGPSITQNLVGNLDLFNPGIATTLAAILNTFNPFGKDINELVLPVVSFEGESKVFNLGDLDVPLNLRPIALDSNFQNPYERSKNWNLDSSDDNTNSDRIDSLAQSVSSSVPDRFGKVNEAFLKRAELADFIAASFNSDDINTDLPVDRRQSAWLSVIRIRFLSASAAVDWAAGMIIPVPSRIIPAECRVLWKL